MAAWPCEVGRIRQIQRWSTSRSSWKWSLQIVHILLLFHLGIECHEFEMVEDQRIALLEYELFWRLATFCRRFALLLSGIEHI